MDKLDIIIRPCKSIPASSDAAAAAWDDAAVVVVVAGVAPLPETPCAPGFRRLDSFFKFSIPPLGGRMGGWCLVK